MCRSRSRDLWNNYRHVILMPPVFTATCVDQDVELEFRLCVRFYSINFHPWPPGVRAPEVYFQREMLYRLSYQVPFSRPNGHHLPSDIEMLSISWVSVCWVIHGTSLVVMYPLKSYHIPVQPYRKALWIVYNMISIVFLLHRQRISCLKRIERD